MDKKIINIKTTKKNSFQELETGILHTLGLLLSRYRSRPLITGNVGRSVVIANISKYTWYKYGIYRTFTLKIVP